MKHIIVLLLAFFPLIVNAQFVEKGKTDLGKMNLKGPVVQVIEETYGVKEAFGEWEKGDKCLSRLSIFDDNGFFLLDTQDPVQLNYNPDTEHISGIGRIKVVNSIQIYSYESPGKISEVNCVYKYRTGALYNLDDLNSWYSKNAKSINIINKYEYNPDGTVKSITSNRITSFGFNDEVLGIAGKDIYKYNNDGYEIWFYKKDGSRDTRKVYNVINSERVVVKRDEGVISELYNEKGQLVALARATFASNGKFRGDYYYGYNEHGDLLAVATNIKASSSIKGLESLYPFIGDKQNENTVVAYGYEYDSHGNWVVCKEYKIRGQEVIVSGWKERTIRYSGDGFDGEAFCKALLSEIEGGTR